ncbi:hypothetical protein QN277_004190 [Acacia crassicarpa]|nr:hypothetical protein QN277_004190 [Acacia crassicarpa]
MDCLGDFNDLLFPSERTGGSGGIQRRFQWFQEKLNNCGLFDLGASGPKFTWKGPRLRGHSRLFERLDKALANQIALSDLPNCALKVLPRLAYSDHNPINLLLGTPQRGYKARPFRFEAMW